MDTARLPQGLILDFGLMSILLVAAHLLRYKIKILQNTFVPTSIIAGFLGLLGGWQVLGRLGDEVWELPFSQAGDGNLGIGSYPGVLIVVLFGTLFLGHREKKQASIGAVAKNVGDTFFYSLGSQVGMYGLTLLFGLVVLTPIFAELHPGFAVMLPAGFAGGHGTAAAMGESFRTLLEGTGETFGEEALTIGSTFATIGVVAAIVGGMVLINLGTRRGWTRMVKSAGEMPASMKSGFVDAEEQKPMGKDTISPIAFDPLAWHAALIGIVLALSYYTKGFAEPLLPEGFVLPTFCLAMIYGALVQKGLDLVGLGRYVDRQIMIRIGSTVSDFLIAFAIASLQLGVVVKYALPLVLTALFGLAYCFAFFWFVGRRLFHNFWFERSLFTYGWNSGVVSMAVILLRIVDPRLRTGTLKDYSLAYLFLSMMEMVMLIAIPPMIVNWGIAAPAVIFTGALLACIVLSRFLVGWFTRPPAELREGEEELLRPES